MRQRIRFYADEHVATAIGDIIRGLMLIYQILDAEEMVGHVEFL
jgi:hypothetical protein